MNEQLHVGGASTQNLQGNIYCPLSTGKGKEIVQTRSLFDITKLLKIIENKILSFILQETLMYYM